MPNNFLNPFQFFFPKKILGIDVGTFSIKIVEISRFGKRKKLENYGAIEASILYQKPFRTFDKSTLLLSSNDIARAIRAVIEESKIKTHRVVFSIPDFSTFFTTFELPSMTKEELPQAVQYEARQYVPLPLGEVTLDWQIIEGDTTNEKKEKLKILLVAVPNEVIAQYKEIAQLAQLELLAIEAEVFGLSRSSIDEDEKGLVALVDIGAQSTTCSIIDRRILKESHSFDMSGNELTEVVSESLSIDRQKAEITKQKYGILPATSSSEKTTKEILMPLIDMILREIGRILNNFESKKTKEIKKVILAGGTALLPGLKEYFAESLKKEIEIVNPFSNIFYPPILEETTKGMGPSYAIAIGSALRGLDY